MVIKNNVAKKKGGFFTIEQSNLQDFGSLYINNTSEEGGIYYGVDNVFEINLFENCSFYNNSGRMSLFSIINSKEILFINVNFENNINILFFILSVNVTLLNSNVNNLNCISDVIAGCVAFCFHQSSLKIINGSFKNITHENLNNGIHLEDSELILNGAIFKTMRGFLDSPSFISASFSIILILNSHFQDYGYNVINLISSHLDLRFSKFVIDQENNFKSSNLHGSIFCSFCKTIFIDSCDFYGNYGALNGGAIQIYKNDLFLEEEKYLIINSNFTNNSALEKGGAIYLIESSLSLFNCEFKDNNAKFGGAIYSEANYNDNNEKVLTLRKCQFLYNRAFYDGGAIKWISIRPIIEETYFDENKALYGNNLASFPLRMNLSIIDDEINKEIYLNPNEIPLLKDCHSGGKFRFSIKVIFIDHDNIAVASLNSKL